MRYPVEVAMTSRRRLRMRVEVVLAIVFALLAVATIVDPRWIEQLLQFDPDNGSGDAEWLITAAFGMASLVTSVLASRDVRLLAAESRR
jgi:hypothetical protein